MSRRRRSRRRALVAQLERVPLLRWFIRSLPGRLSTVFLLAAVATLGTLLYAGPRFEQALVEPRQSSAVSTRSTATFFLAQLAVLGLDPSGYPDALDRLVGPGGQQRASVFELVNVDGALAVRDVEGRQEPSRMVAELAVNGFGVDQGTTTVGEQRRVEAAQVVPQPDGRRIVISIWQPIDDIERTIEIARNRVLLAGIGGAAVALLLGIWVTTRLTRRLRQLEAGARRVAEGDFTAHFRGEGSAELASLARALDEMQRQLAELETARRRFIATASHELRTPLTTLQGFLELLEDDNLDAEHRREFVKHASEQAQRLSKLASDLLDLSRLDVGAVRVRRAPADIGLLLEGLATEFRLAAAEHDTEITRAVDPRAETGLVDSDRVLQVLRALVNNVLTHTPAGTSVVLGAERRGARIAFTVTDDGPGIAPERTRDLFEAFVTADETLGSGLGLAIGRELARRMQGDLTVSSEPGNTVFTLLLPA